MGKIVTVTDVRLTLGAEPGTDVRVRVGNSATSVGLTAVTDASDAGGVVDGTPW
jgi:hypothetical protein